QETTRRDRVGGTRSRRDVALGLGRWTAAAVGLGLLAGCQFPSPFAGAASTVRRIGYLYAGSRAETQQWNDAFVDRLRQLGWLEGQNLSIEWRFAEGNTKVLAEQTAELIGLRVEVLVAPGGFAAESASRQTSTMPIVMMHGPD